MIDILIILAIVLLVLGFSMYVAYLIMMLFMNTTPVRLGTIRSFIREFNKVDWDAKTCTLSFQKNYPKYGVFFGTIVFDNTGMILLPLSYFIACTFILYKSIKRYKKANEAKKFLGLWK